MLRAHVCGNEGGDERGGENCDVVLHCREDNYGHASNDDTDHGIQQGQRDDPQGEAMASVASREMDEG